jgi:pectate lyase
VPLCLHGSKNTGIKKLLFVLLFLAGANTAFSQQTFLITSYGAKADGKTNNAKAIQSAIDAAAKTGAGKVVVPAGTFVTGPLRLQSGVELHLQKGAVLMGSTVRKDYGTGKAVALLSAENATNISLTGAGTIDGRGSLVVENLIELLKAGTMHDKQWPLKAPAEENRPQIITFTACNNVTVIGITLKNSAAWVQTYLRCNNVIINSVTVESVSYWNNDGIDIVNSKNVSITACTINAADDAICLKSEGSIKDSCVNVYVANCKLRSSASAFKMGTGSKGGFRNIRVDGLQVHDTYRSAIALEAVDGGFLENVEIKNVRAMNTGNAILVRLGHRNKDSVYSTVKNIFIANVYVEVPAGKPDKGYPMEGPGLKYPPGFKPAKGVMQSLSPWNHSSRDSGAIPYPHNVFPSSITGLPGHPVENIRLENIEIVYEGGAKKERAFFPADSLTKITEAEASYPEFSMFGELPVWGLYLRHAKDVSMKNITLRYKTDDFRMALIADDVNGLKMEELFIPSYKELPVMILNNVKRYSTNGLRLPVEASKAIKIQ